MASGIGFEDRSSRSYRRYRPLPALIVIAVLGLGSIVVWVHAITSRGDINDAVRCNPPASPPPGTVFTSLDHGALDDASPVPPGKVAIRVLNATTTRGEGAITTESLRQLGFSQIAEPQNDPAYANREAVCRGQIRFGENGTSAARTVSLVVPCAELVKDNRQDASVDLTVGTTFGDVRPKAEAAQVLRQLTQWSEQHQSGGGEQAAAAPGPAIDRAVLTAARDIGC